MRIINVPFLIVMLLTFGGCSLPRIAIMNAIGKSEIPLIDGGKFIKSVPDGSAYQRSIKVIIESPRESGEVLVWYRDKLLADGWELPKESDGWTKNASSNNGYPVFVAQRKRWKFGDQWLSKEQLEFILEDYNDKTTVEITIKGDYLWDWPAIAVLTSFEKVSDPLAWANLWLVEKAGGDEITLAIIDSPMSWAWGILIIMF